MLGSVVKLPRLILERTHTQERTKVRFSFTTEPFVLDFGEEKFGETHRPGMGHKPGRMVG